MFRLKEVRKEKNISQTALSEKSGVSRGIITRLESDRDYVTTTATLRKLAEALEVSVGELFSG